MAIESGHTEVVEWLMEHHPALLDQLVGESWGHQPFFNQNSNSNLLDSRRATWEYG